MAPRDLESMEDYTLKYAMNSETTGYGTDIAVHIPCPWCAHPDFMTLYPTAGIFDERENIDTQMSKNTTCENCGRSGKNIVQRDANGVTFEFVQTGGDDAPEWLIPKMRRV